MRKLALFALLLTAACAEEKQISASNCNTLMPASASALETHLCQLGETGSATTLYNVGTDYLYGREGLKRDCDKARFFLTQAAEKGDLFAQMKMAELDGGGVFTSAQPVKQCVKKDFVHAHAYLRAANQQAKTYAETRKETAGLIPDLEPGLKALGKKLSIEDKNTSDTFYRTLVKETPASSEKAGTELHTSAK
ncbi:MAG: hypothetical protein K2Q01_10095 [Rickettsiales bacterium]|nr:hypothetical protein [Rickettsiales bacterium]